MGKLWQTARNNCNNLVIQPMENPDNITALYF